MLPLFFAQFEEIPREYLIGGGAALVGLLIVVFVIQRLRRHRRPPPLPPVNLSVNLAALGNHGPPPALPTLELYNLPVRLAAVVLAPTGRGSQLPAGMDAAVLVDNIVPGLAQFIEVHKPLVRLWPAQLSTQGFSHTLFANVPLPGDHGKGTPWSVIAGRFETGGQSVLAGLVLCADKPNSLGQFVIERPGQWLDLLRVRRA
jgi:hypothetical protein